MANGNSNASTTTIIVALIGLVGVLGAAWIARMGPPTGSSSGPANAAQIGPSQANDAQANAAQATAVQAAQAGPAEAVVANTAARLDAAPKAPTASDNSATASRPVDTNEKPPHVTDHTATSPLAGRWVQTSGFKRVPSTFVIAQQGGSLTLQSLENGNSVGNPISLKLDKEGGATWRTFFVFDDNVRGHKVASADQADLVTTSTWRASGDQLIRTDEFDYLRPRAGNPQGVQTRTVTFRRAG